MNYYIPTASVHHSDSFDVWDYPQLTEWETDQAFSHDDRTVDDDQFLSVESPYIKLNESFNDVEPSFLDSSLGSYGVGSPSSELRPNEIHVASPQPLSIPRLVPIPRNSGSSRIQRERGLQEKTTDNPSRKLKAVAGTKPKSKGAGPVRDERRLACPYFKMNPERYKYSGACAGPGFPTAHRLKEHLFRRHEMPQFYCPCCYVGFQNQASQDAHFRSVSCITRPLEASPEGFDSDQGIKLRSRKFQTGTEKDKWREIFSILFPDVEPSGIPHPYIESHGPGFFGSESRSDPRSGVLNNVRTALEVQFEFLRGEIGRLLPDGTDTGRAQRDVAFAIRRSQHDILRSLEGLPSSDAEERDTPGGDAYYPMPGASPRDDFASHDHSSIPTYYEPDADLDATMLYSDGSFANGLSDAHDTT